MMISIFLFFFFMFYLLFGFSWIYFSLLFLFMFIFFIYYMPLFGFSYMFWGSSMFFMDFFSFLMVMLLYWSMSMVFLVCVDEMNHLKFILFFFSLFSLSICFISGSFYLFYVFFEFSLIPIFMMILGLGSGEDRLYSGYYMFIYTMFTSLPGLLCLVHMLIFDGGHSFLLYMYGVIDFGEFYYMIFMLLFSVKIPIFLLHIWLPKAHVDAPVYGSMLLASVMLKLGGYGLIRLFCLFDCFDLFSDFYIVSSLFGVLFLGFLCLYIYDMKVLVAYSSIMHMGLMVGGLISGNSLGMYGGVLVMVSHGICSSGLFMMVNLFYLRSGSRVYIFNSGWFDLCSVMFILFFFMILGNIGVPPSLSIVSEIYLVSGLIHYSVIIFFLLILGSFIFSCVMFNMCASMFMGFDGSICFGFFCVKDYFCVFMHLFPLYTLILFIYLI